MNNTYLYTCAHIRAYIRIYTYTHIYTHTHMPAYTDIYRGEWGKAPIHASLPHTGPSIHRTLPIHGQTFMGVNLYVVKHSWEFTHTCPSIHGSLAMYGQSFMGVIYPLVKIRSPLSNYTHKNLFEALVHALVFMGCYPYMAKHSC